jgi:hypothetical protein
LTVKRAPDGGGLLGAARYATISPACEGSDSHRRDADAEQHEQDGQDEQGVAASRRRWGRFRRRKGDRRAGLGIFFRRIRVRSGIRGKVSQVLLLHRTGSNGEG